MMKDTSVLQNYLLDEIKEDCLQDLMTVVMATEDAEMSDMEQIIPMTTLNSLSDILPISRSAMARCMTGVSPEKTDSLIDLFLPITKEYSEARRRLKLKIKLKSIVSSRATSVASSVINEERGVYINSQQGSVRMEDKVREAKDKDTKKVELEPAPVVVKLSLVSKKPTQTETPTIEKLTPSRQTSDVQSIVPEPTPLARSSSSSPSMAVSCHSPVKQDNIPDTFTPVRSSSPVITETSGYRTEEIEDSNRIYKEENIHPSSCKEKSILPLMSVSIDKEISERLQSLSPSTSNVNVKPEFQSKSPSASLFHVKNDQRPRQDVLPEVEDLQIVPKFSSIVRLEELPGYGQSEFESLSSLVRAVKASKAPPPRPTMPQEPLPEEEIVDVVVGEIVDPSKMFIQKASMYDQLNSMMDELDMFYQRLGYNQTEEDFKERTKQMLTVGDHVATLWTDQMWYRARIVNIINHDTFEVFYIDYGTKMKVKKRELFLLDDKFFELPAQAIKAELAGIEPVMDEAKTFNWSGYTKRRVIEATRGSHLTSLVAVVTYKRKDKLGIWLLDHKGRGINELLVEEKYAKYTDTDEKLTQIVSSTKTNLDERAVNIHDQVADLHDNVMRGHLPNDPHHLNHMVMRSMFLYDELLFMEAVTKQM